MFFGVTVDEQMRFAYCNLKLPYSNPAKAAATPMIAKIAATLSALGIFLAAIGLYGVIS